MDDVDPDTLMVVAGIALSLLALLELYSNWKNARKGRSP
jgi:hypothetical protein